MLPGSISVDRSRLAIGHGSQPLVGQKVDLIGNPAHRSIGKSELGAADMVAVKARIISPHGVASFEVPAAVASRSTAGAIVQGNSGCRGRHHRMEPSGATRIGRDRLTHQEDIRLAIFDIGQAGLAVEPFGANRRPCSQKPG